MRDLHPAAMPLRMPCPERHGEEQLSLVVPMYNEEDNVLPLVTQVQAAMAASPWPWQLILVDDGSRDRTATRIREAVAGCPERIGAVILRRNFGQTAAMQAGIDAAEGSIIATMDGDLQNNPHDIVRMVRRLLDEDLDLLVGWRRLRQDNLWVRKLPSWCANRLIVAVTGVRLHDYGCSLKIFRTCVIRQVRLYGEMHRFIPALAADLGARITEVPVHHRPRRAGVSKYGISRTIRVLLDLITVKFLSSYSTRPIQVFGVFGLLCSIAGLAITGWLGFEKLAFGTLLANRPLLWLGILLTIMGFQFITLGLLGELLVRTYHESQDKPVYRVAEVLHAGEPAVRLARGG